MTSDVSHWSPAPQAARAGPSSKGFAQRAIPWAACDRRADEVVAAVGELADDEVIAVELDVTSPQQWETAVDQVVDRFGSLTTLVNNAGSAASRRRWPTRRAEDFENAWRVNCLGAFLGMRASAGPAARGGARGHRQHLQHRSDPPLPAALRLRFVEVGASGPDPNRGR